MNVFPLRLLMRLYLKKKMKSYSIFKTTSSYLHWSLYAFFFNVHSSYSFFFIRDKALLWKQSYWVNSEVTNIPVTLPLCLLTHVYGTRLVVWHAICVLLLKISVPPPMIYANCESRFDSNSWIPDCVYLCFLWQPCSAALRCNCSTRSLIESHRTAYWKWSTGFLILFFIFEENVQNL